jgi:hypothetical protein
MNIATNSMANVSGSIDFEGVAPLKLSVDSSFFLRLENNGAFLFGIGNRSPWVNHLGQDMSLGTFSGPWLVFRSCHVIKNKVLGMQVV